MFTDSHLLPLEAGVPYNVSIAAVNRAGEGQLTMLLFFTKELGNR